MQFVKKNPPKEETDNLLFLEKDKKAVTKTEKEKKDRKRLIRRLSVIAALVAVLLCALVILGAKGWLSAERISLKMSDAQKGRTLDENLPLSMNGLKVTSLDGMEYCFGLLDDLEYTIYSPEANELYAYKHNMSSPVSVTNERRVLLYERGNRQLTVLTRKGILFEKTTEDPVVTADMNEKDQIIAVTRGERYLGQVRVYDKNGDEMLTWNSSDRYVVDAALSPDGKCFAALLLRVENGETSTDVCFFKTGRDEPFASASFDGKALFDLRALTDDVFAAVGTNETVLFENGKQTGVYSYGSRELSFFTVCAKEPALLFAPLPGETGCRGVTLGTRAEETASFTVKGADYFAGTQGGDLLLCEGGTAYRLKRDGKTYQSEKVKVSAETGSVLRLTEKDGRSLLLSLNGVFAEDEDR